MRIFCLLLFCWIIQLVPAHAQDSIPARYTLSDFFLPIPSLDAKVNLLFESLSDEQRVGQMIMTSAGDNGQPVPRVTRLVREQKIGGMILLTGQRDALKKLGEQFDSLSAVQGGLPLLFAADAELSLINMKIKGTRLVKYANKITSVAEVEQETRKIDEELRHMRVTWNFAPVVDLSPNRTVSFRSFGLSKDTIIRYSNAFITTSQQDNIAATVKHFPGHGYVTGDTHKQLVFIDGEMKEVDVYKPLIENGVVSVMIGHIAVKNNARYQTDGLPASVSRVIVTDLLKNEMGFKGIVVTDAMGMGGVANVPQCGLKAAMAGCDIILMPKNEDEVHRDILAEMKVNEAFREQVYASVKKILRFKICLGIIP